MSAEYFHQATFEKALFLLPAERDLLFWTTFRDILLSPLNSPTGDDEKKVTCGALVVASAGPLDSSNTVKSASPRRWASATRVQARDATSTFSADFFRAFSLVRAINAAEVAHVLKYPLSKVVTQLLLASRHGMLKMWFTRPCLQCGSIIPAQLPTIALLLEKLNRSKDDAGTDSPLAPCRFCGEPKFVPNNLNDIQCLFSFPPTIVSSAIAPGLSSRCIFSKEATRRRLTRLLVREQSSVALSIDLPHGSYTILCEERDVIGTLRVTSNKQFSVREDKMGRSEAVLVLDDHSRCEILAADSYVDILLENPSSAAVFVSLHAAFDTRVECGGVNPPRFFSAAELLFASSIERVLFSSLEPFKAFQAPRQVVLSQWSVVSDNPPAQVAVTCILLAACEEQHGAVVGGTTGGGVVRVAFWCASNALATAAIVSQALVRDNFADDVVVTATVVEQISHEASSTSGGLACASLLFHAPREFQFDMFGPVGKLCSTLHRQAEDAAASVSGSGQGAQKNLTTVQLYSTDYESISCSKGSCRGAPFRNDGGDAMFDSFATMVVDMTGASLIRQEEKEGRVAFVWTAAAAPKLVSGGRLSETLIPAFYEDDSTEKNAFAEF